MSLAEEKIGVIYDLNKKIILTNELLSFYKNSVINAVQHKIKTNYETNSYPFNLSINNDLIENSLFNYNNSLSKSNYNDGKHKESNNINFKLEELSKNKSNMSQTNSHVFKPHYSKSEFFRLRNKSQIF